MSFVGRTNSRPRLKKDLWFKLRLGLKIRTRRRAKSGIRAKIHSWSPIPLCRYSKSANLLDLAQKCTIYVLFKNKSVDLKTYSPYTVNAILQLSLRSLFTYPPEWSITPTFSEVEFTRREKRLMGKVDLCIPTFWGFEWIGNVKFKIVNCELVHP